MCGEHNGKIGVNKNGLERHEMDRLIHARNIFNRMEFTKKIV